MKNFINLSVICGAIILGGFWISKANNSQPVPKKEENTQPPVVAKKPTFNERFGNVNIISPSKKRSEFVSSREDERRAAKRRDSMKRRMIQQAEALRKEQEWQHYLTVILPQQREAAQQSFDNSMEFQEMMQRDQMIQLQRDQNFLLQQQIWNQQLREGRQPIYYGVPPYGIDLRYP